MSRVQLALNVADLDDAIDFYSKLFATEPAKLRPGYANFAIAEPPLKLVLIEGHGDAGHAQPPRRRGRVDRRGRRGASAGCRPRAWPPPTEDEVACCYAVQDKVWVDGPDGEPWEIYTVLADAEMPAGELRDAIPSRARPGACCVSRQRRRSRRAAIARLRLDDLAR